MGLFDSEDKSSKKKTYMVDVVCDNCDMGKEDQFEVEVPKGTKVEDFLKEGSCPECGCKTLRKYVEEEDE